MSNEQEMIDALAQEIRRVDGNHDLGAGQLAEALFPFIQAATLAAEARIRGLEALLKKARDRIPTGDTECHGYKCRELNCRSCFDDEPVDEYVEGSQSLVSAINAALTEHKENQG